MFIPYFISSIIAGLCRVTAGLCYNCNIMYYNNLTGFADIAGLFSYTYGEKNENSLYIGLRKYPAKPEKPAKCMDHNGL